MAALDDLGGAVHLQKEPLHLPLGPPAPDDLGVQPWEGRCPGCFLLPEFCLCAQLPCWENRIPVTIIRHAQEQRKTSNTARLACRVLRHCQLLCYGARDRPLDPAQIPSQGHLLFPPALDARGQLDPLGPPVHDLSQGPLAGGCQHLIVLDGTWSQARRMSHRLQGVAQLPRVTFSQVPSRARLRRPPTPHTSATLEALGYALGHLECPQLGLGLLEVFDNFVESYHRQCPKNPKI